jgi:signal transduction histidine kinase
MSSASILLVDDQPANLVALEAILAPLGHRLVSADSGAAALRQLLMNDFAAILLDARMPGLDGYETAALIRQRERSAHTPIIFLTADTGDREATLRAYDQGAVDFLGKPFEPKILRAKVAIFISLYLQGEQLKQQSESLRAQERASILAEAARRTAERLRDLERAHVVRLEEEQRRAELHAVELAQVSAELVRSNRELEQVAYGASHDLKAPLRGIATVCDWLEEDLVDAMTDDARKHLGQLRNRVQRMGAIVDGILAFARVGQKRAQPETVDLGAVLADVVELLQAPEGATIQIAPAMPVAHVQRLLLEQVFANLIGNAIKYARRIDPRVRVGVDTSATDRFFEFWVADNGPGIAEAYHERIWSLFQRLESQDEIEGTGVGLALVKKIVEAQGGRAWVESQPGQGATFRFLWPKVPVVPVVCAAEPLSPADFQYAGDPLDHLGMIPPITPLPIAHLELP